MRSYANAYYRQWEGREQELMLNLSEVRPHWQKLRDANPLEYGAVQMGLSAGAIESILPVATVVETIVTEAHELVARFR